MGAKVPSIRAAFSNAEVATNEAATPFTDRLVELYYDRVLRFLVRLTADPHLAADLAQTTFTELVKRATMTAQARNEWAYIRSTAYYTWRRWREKKRPEVNEPGFFDTLPNGEDEPVRRAIAEEDVRHVYAALARLPDHYRATFVLLVQERATYAEAAALLGVPVKTVGTWRNRAMAQIRQALQATDCSVRELD